METRHSEIIWVYHAVQVPKRYLIIRNFKISGRASYVKLRDLDFIFYDIAVGVRSPIAIWDPDNNSSWNFEIPVENKRNRTTNQPNLPQNFPQNPIC